VVVFANRIGSSPCLWVVCLLVTLVYFYWTIKWT